LRMGAGHARAGSGSSRWGIVFSAATFRMSRMGETPVNLQLRRRLPLLLLLELHNPKQRRVERIPVRGTQNVPRLRHPRTPIPAIRKSRTYESSAMSHRKLFKCQTPAGTHREEGKTAFTFFEELAAK
ncbi:MAG: hypothetical protein WBX16_04635, partial [Candidatus Acidiferrales bacterium]